MKPKRTWVQKRDETEPPHVERLKESKGKMFPAGRMLIASPLAVQSVVEKIPEGHVLTADRLRDHLAKKFKADYTCPLTTGIFLRIVAEAAEEEKSELPYWRVVRADGRLIDKLPGGEAGQAKRLRVEGVACRKAGVRGYRLEDLPAHVWRPE